MSDSLSYKLRSGKPSKLWSFTKGFISDLVPGACYRAQLARMLQEAAARPDYTEMLQRVAYYCKLYAPFSLPADDSSASGEGWLRYRGPLDGFKRKTFHTAYYLDQRELTRYFPRQWRWQFLPGDVYFTPTEPTIVKSRMIAEDNADSVLLKLDKLRHFLFVNDPVPFTQKSKTLIFRGKIRHSRLRTAFMEKFADHPDFDCGVVGRNEGCPEAWMKPKKTIREHLDYKFIMAIEGNDVASNLKWVMSSNALAVMPRPTCETWYMEGRLKPGYHFVEVRDDFADLEEKVAYYTARPDEAEDIIRHAHEWVAQFRDARRERLIGLMVLARYFSLLGHDVPGLPDALRH